MIFIYNYLFSYSIDRFGGYFHFFLKWKHLCVAWVSAHFLRKKYCKWNYRAKDDHFKSDTLLFGKVELPTISAAKFHERFMFSMVLYLTLLFPKCRIDDILYLILAKGWEAMMIVFLYFPFSQVWKVMFTHFNLHSFDL